MSSSTAALGSLGVTFFFSLTDLPTIVAEWAALIPLILQLANPRLDAELVGRVSLLGRLSTDMFPRLGTAHSILRLLENPGKLLDQTSAANKRVWNFMHGGSFPSANGAASEIMTDALARHIQPVSAVVREPRSSTSEHQNQEHKASSSASPTETTTVRQKATETQFRRPQRLRIFQCRRKGYKRSSMDILSEWQNKPLATTLYVLAAIGIAAVLGLYGLFGTCACLVISTVSTVACRMVKFGRVTNFLKSNERDESGGARPDGCMLCATHPNSYIWDLYIGDRGVIDGLLNKHMIAIDGPASQWLVMWFRFADVLQLLAMTFAAAQKGWDGVALLIFMLFDWAVVFVTNLGDRVIHKFMRNNDLGVEVWALDFPGRVAMLMAIYCCSQSNTWSWMDEIVVPTTRRDALLRQLSGQQDTQQVLSDTDRDWISSNLEWTRDAERRIQGAFMYRQ